MVALGGDAFVDLYSESAARAIVTVRDADADALTALAQEHGVPLTPLGRTGGSVLAVEGQFEVPVAEVREAWAATPPPPPRPHGLSRGLGPRRPRIFSRPHDPRGPLPLGSLLYLTRVLP